MEGRGYKIFSVDFLPGHTLDEVVDTLEIIVGTPGRPCARGRGRSIETLEQGRLTQALDRLTDDFKLLTSEEGDAILQARASSNCSDLDHWNLRLRKLILELDQEAVSAQAAFWQKSYYYQSDPRRHNVVFRVDEHGKRTYREIDYGSFHRGPALAGFILNYDIFNVMCHLGPGGNVFDMTVRPWVWTYQEDIETNFPRHTFFEAIWRELPAETRVGLLMQAAKRLSSNIATHIYAFLIEKGEIRPSKAAEIRSA